MRKYIGLLIVIALITHIPFFDFRNILFFSDWTHWSEQGTKDILNFGYGSWVNYGNFGGDNIQYYFNLFKVLWGLVGSYDIGTKLTFFIPIALLGFLSPFFLVRYYTKNDFVAFLLALFYGFNTYFLVRQTSHLPIAFIFALAPLIFLYFDSFLHSLRKRDFLIFNFLYFIGLCYEVRVMYIISLLLLIYFAFFGIEHIRKKTLWIFFGIFLVLQFFINAFWIIPTVLSSGEAISGVANRGLFGNHLFKMMYSLTVFDQSWTGSTPNGDFVPQNIPFYLWFYPLLVIFGLLHIKEYSQKGKKLVFFGIIISLIGILLTKQSAEPFPGLYLWLYNNFPGFNLFREASKFFIITTLGYLIITGVFLDFLSKKGGKIFYGTSCFILIISLLIAKPLITGDIGTIFRAKIEPQEYTILNSIIEEEKSSFKTLWIPKESQWGIFSIQNPRASLLSLVEDEYSNFSQISSEEKSYNNVASYIFEPLSDRLLDISGIKYVIIGMYDSQDNFFKFYGSTPEEYYEKLKKITFLKELSIEGITQTKIFENTEYLSPIFLSNRSITPENINLLSYKNTNFTQFNPSHYSTKITLGKETEVVNISQKNNSNWMLYAGDFSWKESFTKKLYRVDTKNKSLKFINSWTLSKQEIIDTVAMRYKDSLLQEGYPKKLSDGRTDYKYYIENTDGTIDVELTLYFKPQSYFYLGLIISGTTFVILLSYLGYDAVSRRRRKIT